VRVSCERNICPCFGEGSLGSRQLRHRHGRGTMDAKSELRLARFSWLGSNHLGCFTVHHSQVCAAVVLGRMHTWGDFFAAWFIYGFAVVLFTAIAVAAIIYTQEFFLGHDKTDMEGVTFYIVMTVLVGALFILFIAMNWSPSDDDDFDDYSAVPYYLADAR
jgi:amino acid transporter